jgi:GT2 family glycosyltransferase
MTKQLRWGIVMVGRNEAKRLRITLPKNLEFKVPLVYVDSCSSDDSLDYLHSLNVQTLQITPPLSAAKGRNFGFQKIMKEFPELEWIHFVDADCYLDKNWPQLFQEYIINSFSVGVICGYTKEEHKDRSIYNFLLDVEWHGEVGEILSCGGNSLVNAHFFKMCGGFDETLTAGEEAVMCSRMRALGQKVIRIPETMSFHDGNIHKFNIWWRRMIRSGYAMALGAHRYPITERKFELRRLQKTIAVSFFGFLALLLPLAPQINFIDTFIIVMICYFLYFVKIILNQTKKKYSFCEASKYSAFCIIGKWAELWGILKYVLEVLQGNSPKLIEYK